MFAGQESVGWLPRLNLWPHHSRAGFWNDRAGEAEREARELRDAGRSAQPGSKGAGDHYDHADDDRPEAGMRGGRGHSGGDQYEQRGNPEGRSREGRRQQLKQASAQQPRKIWLWLLCPLVLLVLIPLRDNDADEAQTSYDHALKLFQQQRTDAARAEAAAGWERYRDTDPVFAAEYQLLYAGTLKNAGEDAEGRRVLASYPDTGPSEGAVQRYVMEARALASMGKPEAAEQRLTRAD